MIHRSLPTLAATIRMIAHRFRGEPYTRDFFLEQDERARSSAEVVVPIVMEFLKPRSVVDVGCGSGRWLAVFAAHGVREILGVDSEALPSDVLAVPSSAVLRRDLTYPLTLHRTFDLVVCLEVAEHIPPEAGERLVSSLTDLGPFVLFSAAIPHQGGTNHVNEQWPDYWARAFSNHGYVVVDCIRRRIWHDPAVAFWYAQNTLLFVEEAALVEQPTLRAEHELMGDSQLSIVHPQCYQSLASAFYRVVGRARLPSR